MNEDFHDSELGLHSASQSEKSTKKKKEEVLELPFWTINAGGHPGVWRLISLLESMTPWGKTRHFSHSRSFLRNRTESSHHEENGCSWEIRFPFRMRGQSQAR